MGVETKPSATSARRARFRKKSVVIEAVQLPPCDCPDGAYDVTIGQLFDFMAGAEWEAASDGVRIVTLEGEMHAQPGDWIIKGVAGEFYPCKPDIFAATYEPEGVTRPAEDDPSELREALKQVRALIEVIEQTSNNVWWVNADDPETAVGDAYPAIEDALSKGTAPSELPIQMILHCPRCHVRHIDGADDRTPDWTNPPHRSHLCHACGCIWRPADVPTEGVRSIATVGKADTFCTTLAREDEQ